MTTFRCTHLVLPSMLERGSGRIINIGSTAGFIGDRFLAVYSAAKGGVHAFTRVLALELGESGITVNAIAPYGTRSDDPYSDMSSGSRIHPETGVFARAGRRTRSASARSGAPPPCPASTRGHPRSVPPRSTSPPTTRHSSPGTPSRSTAEYPSSEPAEAGMKLDGKIAVVTGSGNGTTVSGPSGQYMKR